MFVRDGAVRAHAHAPRRCSDDDDDWYRAAAQPTRALADFDARADAQGPALRPGVLLRDAAARARRGRRRARGQQPAGAARLEREARDPALPAVHAAHAGGERHGARSTPSSTSTRDVIVKKLDGMGGTMIFRVRADDPNRNVIVETHDRRRRAHGDGAALHPRDRQGRQARAGDRRQARSALPRAHPQGGRDARQPRRGRPRRGAAASRRATARSPRRVGRSS